jgi:Arc/MetJ family transcription regulator
VRGDYGAVNDALTESNSRLIDALVASNAQLIKVTDALTAALMSRTGTEFAQIKRAADGPTPRQTQLDLSREAVESDVRRTLAEMGYRDSDIPDVPEGF